MTGLLIRDLEIADLDPLLDLYRELHPNDAPLPARTTVENLWRTILNDPALIYLGGFVDGKLVSACNATIVPNLTRGARSYAIIENVITTAACRRRKYGSLVMRELVDRCRTRRCYKIMLMSGIGRSAIHGFYEALGFDKHAKQAFVMNLE